MAKDNSTMISLLPSVFKPEQTSDIDIYELMNRIISGMWREPIEKLRKMPEEAYKKNKPKLLPAVTISGKFSVAKADGLIQHSGFICIDIDNLDDDLTDTFNRLKDDPYIHFLAKSASGKGLFGFVRIPDNPEKHKDIASNLIKYFADTHDVVLDKSCTDIPRKRFVSYDPEAVINPNSKQFRKTASPKPAPSLPIAYTDSDISYVIEQITASGISLAEDYHDWYRLGWALIDGLPEAQAREYFHLLSSFSQKYKAKQADRKFDQLLKERPKDVTFGTFFYMAKAKGVQIQLPQTKVIFRSAQFSKKGKTSKESAVRKITDLYPDTPTADAQQIVEQVYAKNQPILPDEETPVIVLIKQFVLENYEVQFNEVKNKVEISGQLINDQTLNSIYIAACEVIGDKVRKSDVQAIIESADIPTYHPIRQFLEANAHIQPTGIIAKTIDCIKSPYDKVEATDFGLDLPSGFVVPERTFKEHFFRKWMISLIESAYGLPPRFQLVLTGKQYSGKTTFFRNLLPESLRTQYYSEASMDGGKDIMIRMAEHWLMCNDEMGGKVQHKDEKRMKNIISTDTITERRAYGRYDSHLKRLAAWAGTSNESDLIHDHTGNSRLVPIEVDNIDFDAFNAIDKTALIMEAYHAYKDGERSVMERWELEWLAMISRQFSSVPIEVELIESLYEKPDTKNSHKAIKLSATEIMLEINADSDSQILRSNVMLGKWLKALGFEQEPVQRMEGKITRPWLVVRRRNIQSKDYTFRRF